jgi:hypothetical protein
MAQSLAKILGYEFVEKEIVGKVLMERQSAFGEAISPLWRVKRGGREELDDLQLPEKDHDDKR